MSAVLLPHITWRTNAINIAHILSIAFVASIPISNTLTTILSLILLSISFIYMDKAAWYTSLRNPTTIAILFFVTLSIVCSFESLGSSKDIGLALRKNTRLLYYVLLLPLFLQRQWRNFANIAFLIIVFISVIAAILFGWPLFKDPIFTSLFVVFAVFMLAHFSFVYKKYRKITIPVAIFFTYYLMFLNTGRVGQILFLLLMPLCIWQHLKFNLRTIYNLAIAGCILLMTLFFMSSTFIMRQAQAWHEIKDYIGHPIEQTSHESSLGIRLILAKNSWELIKRQPLMGYGSGAFRNAYTQYATEPQYNIGIIRANPHNQYLLVWVELGLAGIFLLCCIIATCFYNFWNEKSLDGYLGMGLVLCLLIGCTINSWLLDVTSAFFFSTMLAVYAAGVTRTKTS